MRTIFIVRLFGNPQWVHCGLPIRKIKRYFILEGNKERKFKFLARNAHKSARRDISTHKTIMLKRSYFFIAQ